MVEHSRTIHIIIGANALDDGLKGVTVQEGKVVKGWLNVTEV